MAAEQNQRRLRGYPKAGEFLQAHKEKLCVVGTESSPCLVPGVPSALTTSLAAQGCPEGGPLQP